MASGKTGAEDHQEQGSTPQQEAKITTSVVKKLLETHWSKDKASEGAKINPDAVALTAEYLRLFVVEAHQRAQLEAELEGDDTLEPHHIERIMLGMLLDF
ncbi:unnamed protein product [Ascophyllum nodosum]